MGDGRGRLGRSSAPPVVLPNLFVASGVAGGSRRQQLGSNLAAMADRIEQATRLAGRDPGSVQLIVVTKTWPASDVDLLVDLGVVAVGENRVAELVEKRAGIGNRGGLSWHLIGGLQTNKAKAAAEAADVIESVDRPKLAVALARAAAAAGRRLECLVQVNLDPVEIPGRGGVRSAAARDLAERIAADPGLRLGGVMGVGPRGADPRPAFELLTRVGAEIQADHPGADVVSAGMSSDFMAAIAAGATHIRIGTAVLGNRPELR